MERRYRRAGALAVTMAVLVGGAYAAGQQAGRAGAARIKPLEDGQLTAEHKEMLGAYARPGQTLALFRVCVQTPELCKAWLPASRYFGTSPVSLRDRELLILRTCWLTKNEYTWGNHVAAARRAGLTDEDLVRITQGPRARGWSDADAALLQAADALHAEQFIPDGLWKTLSSRYSARELSDLIFIAGQYTFVAMWARNAGLPMEPGAPGFPK